MISSSFWSSLEKGVTEVVAFLVFLVLARLLQPADYGIVALALVFVTLMGTISGLGMAAAVVQIRELDSTHLSSGFWLSLITGLLFYALIYTCAPYLGSFFREPELEYVLLSLGFIGIFQAADAVPIALLSRNFRFRHLAVRSIVSTLIGGGIGIALAMRGHGVWALVAQQLSMAFLRTVITWSGLGWRPTFAMSWAPLKELLSVGVYVLGSVLSNTVSRQADSVLIGRFLGTLELGVYSIGFKVSQTANSVLLNSLSRLGLPTFSRLQSSSDELTTAYQRFWVLGTALTLPVFALIGLTASELVPSLFGDQWRESATVLQVLMVASGCQALINFDGPLLIACGKAKAVFRLTLLRALLNVFGFAIAVKWGINAVAAAFAIASLMMLPIWKLAIRKYSPVAVTRGSVQFVAIAVGLTALSGTVLFVGSRMPDSSVLARIFTQWMGGFLVYGAVVYALNQSLREAMQYLLKLGFRKQ